MARVKEEKIDDKKPGNPAQALKKVKRLRGCSGTFGIKLLTDRCRAELRKGETGGKLTHWTRESLKEKRNALAGEQPVRKQSREGGPGKKMGPREEFRGKVS